MVPTILKNISGRQTNPPETSIQPHCTGRVADFKAED
jgi:hypothetical protein